MPSFKEHSEHSRHNLAFLESFFLNRFNDWAITVMFYTSVHIVESILDKNYFIHSQNHGERSDNLAKLKLTAFPEKAYRVLKKEANDSRYKRYKVCSWEIHLIFKEYFLKLVKWFNSQVEESQTLDIQVCKNFASEWFKKYQAKEPDCNKYC